MRSPLNDLLEELRLQLELDEQRGSAPLPVRARALRAASAAGDHSAERQALIDLAAACIARAAALPAPRFAIAELERRSSRRDSGPARSSSPARCV